MNNLNNVPIETFSDEKINDCILLTVVLFKTIEHINFCIKYESLI